MIIYILSHADEHVLLLTTNSVNAGKAMDAVPGT